MEAIAVIPAAGIGRRMGTRTKKQYLQLGGRPVIAGTLDSLERCEQVAAVALVVGKGEEEQCRREIVERFGYRKVQWVTAGGATRQESVFAGLRAIRAGRSEPELVVVHDGVRPLAEPALFTAALQAAKEVGAAITAVPVKDTIKAVNNGRVERTLDRARLYAVQTPQAFRYQILLAAHEQAFHDGFTGTDDSALVERLGVEVAVVPGSYQNIKITTPEDLAIAGYYAAESSGGGRRE